MHLTDEVKNQLLEQNTDILAIPPSCASTYQPMDVRIKKAIMQNFWVNYVSSLFEIFPDETNQDWNFKLPLPTRQHMVD